MRSVHWPVAGPNRFFRAPSWVGATTPATNGRTIRARRRRRQRPCAPLQLDTQRTHRSGEVAVELPLVGSVPFGGRSPADRTGCACGVKKGPDADGDPLVPGPLGTVVVVAFWRHRCVSVCGCLSTKDTTDRLCSCRFLRSIRPLGCCRLVSIPLTGMRFANGSVGTCVDVACLTVFVSAWRCWCGRMHQRLAEREFRDSERRAGATLTPSGPPRGRQGGS